MKEERRTEHSEKKREDVCFLYKEVRKGMRELGPHSLLVYIASRESVRMWYNKDKSTMRGDCL